MVRLLISFLFLQSLAVQVVFAQRSEADPALHVYKTLEEALPAPQDVQILSLKNRRLTEVPKEVFDFPNLKELDLSRNKISVLPAEIGRLTGLQSLDLSNNQLDSLPSEIGNLTSLVYLGLNRNRIQYLPESIGELSSLEVFELWDNELEEVPDEIGKLQNLRLLELRGILFTQEEQTRIDQLVVKSAKVYMSPSCNCKN
ncbi:MAG: leucine-rich repeat domain-containing protein [Bacteroidota bacterium]